MTAIISGKKRNGYVQLPTYDSEEEIITPLTVQPKSPNLNLKPGLFVKFSKDHSRHHQQGTHNASESAEEIEMTNMKRKRPKQKRSKSSKSPTTKKPESVIEEPLLPGDTIQRVSLRYTCPVAELRRINKLYNDTDFYALKTIKIPVKEHSLLTDASEREKRRTLVVETTSGEKGTHSSGGTTSADEHLFGGPESYYNSDVSQDADDEYGGEESDTAPEYRDISIQSALRWKHTGQSLLEKLDEDLQKVKDDQQQSNIREVRLTFDSPSIHPVSVQEYTKSLFDIPDWRVLLLCAVGIIIFIAIGGVVLCVQNHCPFT